MIFHPDALPYDGTKSIKHVHLLDFFKMMNLIIASNIDHQQHKMKVSVDRMRFMIRVTRMVPIDLSSIIFARMQSETTYVMMDIFPYAIMITRYLLKSGLLLDVVEHVQVPMGPINSTTLSWSTGHSTFWIRAQHNRDKPVDTKAKEEEAKEAQPLDHGVSVGETSTQL